MKEQINELELIAKARAGNENRIPTERLDAVVKTPNFAQTQRIVVARARGTAQIQTVKVEQEFEFHNGAAPDNVIDEKWQSTSFRTAPR